MNAAIQLAGLTKHFGERVALNAISATIPTGGITGLVGPDGAGKSTLLRIIAGLDRAPSDVLRWQGRELAALLPEARRIGLVFQDSRLFPHMTVLGNR
ncbi:ATP-binding cassette domain-containing protein, partial [Aeromonas hydrophila]|uniref:ATP-binding cassette domain-containing protein n=1 Tax=Aeromonas hydrophila TaxID=644 RepID=UPI0038D0493C